MSRYERGLKSASPVVWLLLWPAALFALGVVAYVLH